MAQSAPLPTTLTRMVIRVESRKMTLLIMGITLVLLVGLGSCGVSAASTPEQTALDFIEGFFGDESELLEDTLDWSMTFVSGASNEVFRKDQVIARSYTTNRDFYVKWAFRDVRTSYEGASWAQVSGILSYSVFCKVGTFGRRFEEIKVSTNRTFTMYRSPDGSWLITKITDN